MGYAETLEYIHSVKWQGSKPGLERTKRLLKMLGNPERKLKFVHIAGTNGKGSTAACISAVLRRAGYKTGLYTSPYIMRFNERMQVNGVYISDDELVRMTDEIRPFADSMEDSPTEFELITALALKYFLFKECDIVVLEVGMGGELDSTNVIETPEAAVIASIALDHISELGPELSNIARAKSGIIKNGGDVIFYGGVESVESEIISACQAKNAALHKTDFSRIVNLDITLDGAKFDFSPYVNISLPLAGSYQPKNAALAITALEALRGKGYKISDDDIIMGLSEVKWPGRFEILRRDPVFILDGAHNPHGIEATADSLQKHFGGKKIIFLIGVMADKEIDTMMSKIAPLAQEFIAVRPNHPRAMNENQLSEYLEKYRAPVTAHSILRDGVMDAISRAGKSGIVCALGSLYFSGDVRSIVAQTQI